MDYWPRLKLTVHDDTAAFFSAAAAAGGQLWFFSTKGAENLWRSDFSDGDWLVFGSETNGIANDILDARRGRGQVVRIPQASGERCLNLSTAAGVGQKRRSLRWSVTILLISSGIWRL